MNIDSTNDRSLKNEKFFDCDQTISKIKLSLDTEAFLLAHLLKALEKIQKN